MENKEIIKQLKLMVALLELHQDQVKSDDNFKIRGYNNAIFNIERLEKPIGKLSLDELCKIDGIGKGIAASIYELTSTGKSAFLDNLIQKTPPGILEILKLKGIGPKKIRTIWEELNIETPLALLQACEEGKVRKLKGFGEKTEANIKQSLLYIAANKNKMHFYNAEQISKQLQHKIQALFPDAIVSLAGEVRRKMEVIEQIDLVVGTDQILNVYDRISNMDLLVQDVKISGPFVWRGHLADGSLKVEIHFTQRNRFYNQLLLLTGNAAHLCHGLDNNKTLISIAKAEALSSEEAAYEMAQLPYIVPELREGLCEFIPGTREKLPQLLSMDDLKGVIHCHSTYSDGVHSLRQMAEKCLMEGYKYLGISDHSKSAFYANGLDEFRIVQQHQEIDSLNKELAPFRIFKGIESDILNDGSLDYSSEILASFDFVIASIHSNLGMDQAKATNRLINAISNPFTTFLGHPTGRLLLRRDGYPIDHKAVIEACQHYGVIIEINANPHRLDLDWRWVDYALEKNVLLSINPDAHETGTVEHMYYGVCVARKGGLTKSQNFNSFSLEEAAQYFINRRTKHHLEKNR